MAVDVLLGAGDGTFSAKFTSGPGVGALAPYSVAVADFNADQRLDVALANAGSDNVSVLLGRGDGRLSPATQFPADKGPTR
ncbi:MAG TPA: FG-GAP-like repeat-containing protein [Thermoleophilaceae bacterium]|jgi:hypothetical protein|nr:FG-GAP-like repeat-containing protein [Thermoleophilaceae bacterium]